MKSIVLFMLFVYANSIIDVTKLPENMIGYVQFNDFYGHKYSMHGPINYFEKNIIYNPCTIVESQENMEKTVEDAYVFAENGVHILNTFFLNLDELVQDQDDEFITLMYPMNKREKMNVDGISITFKFSTERYTLDSPVIKDFITYLNSLHDKKDDPNTLDSNVIYDFQKKMKETDCKDIQMVHKEDL